MAGFKAAADIGPVIAIIPKTVVPTTIPLIGRSLAPKLYLIDKMVLTKMKVPISSVKNT